MYKVDRTVIALILTFILGIVSVTGWYFYQDTKEVQIILPNKKWEPRLFQNINKTTELSGLAELRKTNLRKGDLEIRVWNGFGLTPLEGFILKRTNDEWTAFHIKTNWHYESPKAEVKQLNPPKSGWESFWQQISEKGILTIHTPSTPECEISRFLDGTSYVVEFIENKIYRTYQYPAAAACIEGKRMEEIGNIIGLEFDSGTEECKTAEWFPCVKIRMSRK